MGKIITIERIDNAWLLTYDGDKRESVTEDDIDKKFGEICGVRGVTKELGPVTFYVDSCLSKNYDKLHPEITNDLMVAKEKFVRFHHPKDKDKILVLNFEKKGADSVSRMEVLGADAEKVDRQTELKKFSMCGVPAIIILTQDERKEIAQFKPQILDVTDEKILEWYKTHTSMEEVPNNRK